MDNKNKRLKILLITVIGVFSILVFAYMFYSASVNGAVTDIYLQSGVVDEITVGERLELTVPFTVDEDAIYGIKIYLDTDDEMQDGRITISILSAQGDILAVSEKNGLIESDTVFAFDNPVTDTAGREFILKLDCESASEKVFIKSSDYALEDGQYAPAFGIVISGKDSYLLLQCIVYALLIALIIFAFCAVLFGAGHKIDIDKLYLVAGLCLGFIYALIIPIYAGPDEPTHLYTAYEVSNKILGTDGDTLMMRTSDATAEYIATGLNRNTYNYEYDGLFDGVGNAELTATEHSAAARPWYVYFISGLGITIGRLFNLGTTLTYLLGRILNMIVFVFAVYYSIKILPFGKGIVFVWALLPITLQQTSSFSYDSPILALSILVAATSMSAIYGDKKNKRNRIITWVVFAVAAALLIPCKGHALVPLVFIPLILVFRYIKENWEKIKAKIKGLKLWIKIISAVIILTVIALAVVKAMSIIKVVMLPENINNNYIAWANSSGYTVGYFLKNPIKLIELLINTVWIRSDVYLHSLLGGYIGWFEIEIQWIFVLGFLILILYASMRKENEPQFVKTGERIYIILIAVAVAGLAMAGMLFYWTPSRYTSIEGVQGRYFLPALVPFAMILRTKKTIVSDDADYNVAMWAVFLQLFVVTAVFRYIL